MHDQKTKDPAGQLRAGKISRREFLARAGAFGLGAAAANIAASESAQADPRIPTASDAKGPFYVSGMPVSENLNRFGKPGEVMEVRGIVRSAAAPDYAPIEGVKLEVWQADGKGDYHPGGNIEIMRNIVRGDRDLADYDDSLFDMRGTALTDAEGKFFFRTVVPGHETAAFFPLAKHIHYRITAPGYRELITQHYLLESGEPESVPHRSAEINRDGATVTFSAPEIFLQPE